MQGQLTALAVIGGVIVGQLFIVAGYLSAIKSKLDRIDVTGPVWHPERRQPPL